MQGEVRSLLFKRGVRFDPESVDTPTVNTEAVVGMVTWIDENKPEGAILVFLPGWMEIRTVKEQLAMLPGGDSHFMVVPAHSKLSSEDQHRIFDVPQDGRRKVISYISEAIISKETSNQEGIITLISVFFNC